MRNAAIPAILSLLMIVVVSGCVSQQSSGAPAANQSASSICNDASCLSASLLSCAPAEVIFPFGEGINYTITVVGVENGECHWGTSVATERKDCRYPLAAMSQDVINHLFGQDKTGTSCISQQCVAQEQMMNANCNVQ